MMSKISREMQEVWDIKQACNEEVKDLPLIEALEKRLTDSMKTVKELGIKTVIRKTLIEK